MADQEPKPTPLASPFPAPPPFYQHFTKQNLAQLRQRRKTADATAHGDHATDHDDDADPHRNIDLLSLPTELRYLIPPPPPSDDRYRCFGADIDLHAPMPSLADLGIEQPYPDDPSVRLNPQPQLIALARSLLTTFLSLMGVLSENPELYEARVQDLKTIVANMHDLINGYRPHQARETLILMMEERVEKMRREIKAVEESRAGVVTLLQSMQDSVVDAEDVKPNLSEAPRDVEKGGRADAKRKARQRAAWAALAQDMEDG